MTIGPEPTTRTLRRGTTVGVPGNRRDSLPRRAASARAHALRETIEQRGRLRIAEVAYEGRVPRNDAGDVARRRLAEFARGRVAVSRALRVDCNRLGVKPRLEVLRGRAERFYPFGVPRATREGVVPRLPQIRIDR